MKSYFQNFEHLSDREKFLYILSFEDKMPLLKYISNTTTSSPAAVLPDYVCNVWLIVLALQHFPKCVLCNKVIIIIIIILKVNPMP